VINNAVVGALHSAEQSNARDHAARPGRSIRSSSRVASSAWSSVSLPSGRAMYGQDLWDTQATGQSSCETSRQSRRGEALYICVGVIVGMVTDGILFG
jgi:hypothetical protein